MNKVGSSRGVAVVLEEQRLQKNFNYEFLFPINYLREQLCDSKVPTQKNILVSILFADFETKFWS